MQRCQPGRSPRYARLVCQQEKGPVQRTSVDCKGFTPRSQSSAGGGGLPPRAVGTARTGDRAQAARSARSCGSAQARSAQEQQEAECACATGARNAVSVGARCRQERPGTRQLFAPLGAARSCARRPDEWHRATVRGASRALASVSEPGAELPWFSEQGQRPRRKDQGSRWRSRRRRRLQS